MPYTLMKGLVWILLALLLGIVMGWLLRHVTAKRQVARARAHHVDTVEMERLRGRVANLEPIVAERDRLRAELDASTGAGAATPGAAPAVVPADGVVASVASVPCAPDVAGASSVIGRSIKLDDLQVIEGIGPRIEALCHGIGIRTWYDLSTTEVSLLRTMLADAGPRLRSHDPATWPEQAGLLAAGRWGDWKALVEAGAVRAAD